MRRKDREVTNTNEIIKMLERGKVCRVAFHDGEYPYIVPLNYAVKRKDTEICLYFHGTNKGKKYELLEKNYHVGFETDNYEEYKIGSLTTKYESVVGYGTMEVVQELEEKWEAIQLIMDFYGEDSVKLTEQMVMNTTVTRLRIASMSGKCNENKETHKSLPT